MPILASLFKQLLPPDSKPTEASTTTPTAATAAVSTLPPPPSTQSPPAAPRQSTTAAVAALHQSQQEPRDSSVFSSRSLKQLGLFFAGATFLALSTALTRRSVIRKQAAAKLKFYSPSSTGQVSLSSGATAAEVEAAAASATKEEAPHGSFMAVEALNLATLNVLSFFIMLTGGVSWAFDLSSVEDLRTLAQKYTRGQSMDGSGRIGGLTDEEAEREVEEWVAKVLKKSDGTLIGGSNKATDGDAKN